jgi:hypothetical protein
MGNRFLGQAIVFASLLASCSSAHSGSERDAGQEDARMDDAYVAIPGEMRRLRAEDGDRIHELAVDSQNHICALVTRASRELHYGCFDATDTFVSHGLIATGSAGCHGLALDPNDNPSMICGAYDAGAEFTLAGVTHTQASCAVRLEGEAVWAECVSQPFFIRSFAHNERTHAVAAVIASEEVTGMLGPFEMGLGIYIASGLPIVERTQLHLFIESNIGAYAIFPAEDGGWFIAGDYFSAPGWMLPESPSGQAPFWLKVDADFHPLEAHTYPHSASATSWSLGADGRIVGIAFSFADGFDMMPTYFVGEGLEPWVPIGVVGPNGGIYGARASSTNIVALGQTWNRMPFTIGPTTFDYQPRTQVLATFTRTGEFLAARRVPGDFGNAVLLHDGAVAYAEGNLVHVLSIR